MKISKVLFVCLMIMAFSVPSFAEDRRKLLIDSVDYAVKVLETKGQAGMDELKAFRFAGEEGYVYITDMDAVVIMHPVAKELVGKNCMTIKGAEGKYFGAEMLGKAKKDGIGWTTYMWLNKKNNNKIEPKCSHFKVANMAGQKVVVYAALNEVTECK